MDPVDALWEAVYADSRRMIDRDGRAMSPTQWAAVCAAVAVIAMRQRPRDWWLRESGYFAGWSAAR